MTHHAVRRQLSALLDGDLPPARRARIERHLAECRDCRAEAEALRRVVALLRALPDEGATPAIAEPVMARIAAGDGRPRGPERVADAIASWLESAWLAPAATAIVGLLIVSLVRGVDVDVTLRGRPPVLAREVLASAPAPTPEPVVEDAGDAEPASLAARLASSETLANPMAPPAGLPPMAACLDPSAPPTPACARWHAWSLGLVMRDPPAFLAHVRNVPRASRDRWIGQLSHFAADSGTASEAAAELRKTGDPLGSSIAVSFESTAPTPSGPDPH